MDPSIMASYDKEFTMFGLLRPVLSLSKGCYLSNIHLKTEIHAKGSLQSKIDYNTRIALAAEIGETGMATTYIGTVRNGKVEFEPPLTLPDGSQVRVTLSSVLDERQAAGPANVWLANQVGDAVGVRQGTLVQVEDRTIWRFEAFITGVHLEPIGPIGHIEVDADTGEVLGSSEMAEAMIERGRQLAPAP
jgi:hypothetical protein